NRLYLKATDAARQEFKLLNQSNALFQRPLMSDEEIERRAAERGQQAVTSHRLTLGSPGLPGARPVPGEKTSGNPGAARPPVGVPRAPGATEKTSGNPGAPKQVPWQQFYDTVRVKNPKAWDR